MYRSVTAGCPGIGTLLLPSIPGHAEQQHRDICGIVPMCPQLSESPHKKP